MSPARKPARTKRGPGNDKNQIGVRIVVEFTGYIDKNKAVQFSEGIGSLLRNRRENGGGGN